MEIIFYTLLGNEAIVELLLRNSAKVNAVEPDGSTALHRAAIKGIISKLVTQFSVNNLRENSMNIFLDVFVVVWFLYGAHYSPDITTSNYHFFQRALRQNHI